MFEKDVTFTTTATNRPKIIDRTYRSFHKNLINFDTKKTHLIINIDPLPSKVKNNTICNITQQYFKKVIINIPNQPNFTSAINWLWTTAKTKYIFHLEDDWVLNTKINFEDLIKLIKNPPQRLQCVLRAYDYEYKKMALSPSLIKRKLYKAVAGKLNSSLNPEIQLRDKNIVGFLITKKHISVYGKHIVVSDIGRDWIKKQPFQRPSKKAYFNSWIKK